MRVLVTGHAGYIGSVLAPMLQEHGHEVVGADTFFYAGCDFGVYRPIADERALDVRDVQATDLAGFDAVVHLAALSNDPLGDLDPDLTFAINLDGTVTLARAAKEAGVRRFVFASSCSMYGASGSDDALVEGAALRPITPYADSKARAEEALFALCDSDFGVVAMRNATVYGVSPRLRLDIVLNNLAAWAVTTGRIRLLSDGRAWRPLVHVRDLCTVTEVVLRAPAAVVAGKAFNVGSEDQNYVVRDLATTLAGVTDCEVETANEATADPRSYRVDFTKLARAFPDLRFEWDAARGARELVDAYVAEGLSAAQFEGRRYFRLRQLKHLLDDAILGGDLRWSEGAPVVADRQR
jgi:nucleoside-diphosphate-sugar epimerase